MTYAADDFTVIRARREELRREQERLSPNIDEPRLPTSSSRSSMANKEVLAPTVIRGDLRG